MSLLAPKHCAEWQLTCPTKPDDYGPNIFNQFVIDFAKRNREKPFFVYYTSVLTHGPHLETPDPNQPGKRWPEGFKSNLEYLDHLMGQFDGGFKERRVGPKHLCDIHR